ncbi:MAG: HAD family phosphatase [Anaerolineaceae bacterium]|jgi:HAD superfamily hydrolase (TIGR01509 family)|nr:HAD family phosphatase [Anaerolineaceae bacterium]
MQSITIKGVVFDLDGVMLDSEAISMDVWRDILSEHNAVLSEEDYGKIIGMSGVPAAKFIVQQTGAPIDPVQIMEHHWDKMISVIQNMGVAEAGLIDILDQFAALSLPLAVASNSPSFYVHSTLKALGVADRFATVTCANEISHSKPHPEIYLKAAESIHVAPENCLAIEDSPIGLQAALAAGMRCVIIQNPHIKNPDYKGAYSQHPTLLDYFNDISASLN